MTNLKQEQISNQYCITNCYYCQTSNISHTSVGNKIVDCLDVVGALPVGAAPTTHLHSRLNISLQWIGQWQLQDEMRNI